MPEKEKENTRAWAKAKLENINAPNEAEIETN